MGIRAALSGKTAAVAAPSVAARASAPSQCAPKGGSCTRLLYSGEAILQREREDADGGADGVAPALRREGRAAVSGRSGRQP